MNSQNVRRALLAVSFSLPLAFSLTAAAEPLGLQDKVPFDKGVHVPDAVKAECGLEAKIAEYVKGSASGFEKVSMGAAKGKSLDMKITGLLATAGGGFSGPKSVTVSGTLRQGGKVTGTFTAQRYSGGGAFGGGGTCNILDRCAKAIGKDIGAWLKSPTMNAKLGDAK
jgi:hypothetical protein